MALKKQSHWADRNRVPYYGQDKAAAVSAADS